MHPLSQPHPPSKAGDNHLALLIPNPQASLGVLFHLTEAHSLPAHLVNPCPYQAPASPGASGKGGVLHLQHPASTKPVPP